jgi:hypothetical protein
MSFRKVVLLLAAAASALTVSATAHAQLGVYGEFTVNRLTGMVDSPLPSAPGVADVRANSVDPLGGTGGVYYDFWKLGPVKIGADLRGNILTTKRGAYVNFNGPGARIYSALGGIRAVFHTPLKPLKPYIEGAAGLGRSDYGLYNNSVNGQPNAIYNNFEYQAYAGLDIKVLPIMDYRVAELGYGGLDPFGTYSHNYPIKSVSMGFVFHLPF